MNLDQIMAAAFELVGTLDTYLHRVNEAEKLGHLAAEQGRLEDYEAALVLTPEQVESIKAEKDVDLQAGVACELFALQLQLAVAELLRARNALASLFREPISADDASTPEDLFAVASGGLVMLNGQRARSYMGAILLYSDFVLHESVMALRRLTPDFAKPEIAGPEALPEFNGANWFAVCQYLCQKLRSFETADTVAELLESEYDEAMFIVEGDEPLDSEQPAKPKRSQRVGGRPRKWEMLDGLIEEGTNLSDAEIARRHNAGQWKAIDVDPSLKADEAKVRERRNELNRQRKSPPQK